MYTRWDGPNFKEILEIDERFDSQKDALIILIKIIKAPKNN